MSDDPGFPLDLAKLGFKSIDLLALTRDLLQSEQAAQNGRAARTLAKSRGLTAVLTVVPAGGNVGAHSAPGPVLIVPLAGTPILHGDPDPEHAHPLPVGEVLFLGEGQQHRVSATEDCAFLIIIGLQSRAANPT